MAASMSNIAAFTARYEDDVSFNDLGCCVIASADVRRFLLFLLADVETGVDDAAAVPSVAVSLSDLDGDASSVVDFLTSASFSDFISVSALASASLVAVAES